MVGLWLLANIRTQCTEVGIPPRNRQDVLLLGPALRLIRIKLYVHS